MALYLILKSPEVISWLEDVDPKQKQTMEWEVEVKIWFHTFSILHFDNAFLQVTRINFALLFNPWFRRLCTFCSYSLQHSSSMQYPSLSSPWSLTPLLFTLVGDKDGPITDSVNHRFTTQTWYQCYVRFWSLPPETAVGWANQAAGGAEGSGCDVGLWRLRLGGVVRGWPLTPCQCSLSLSLSTPVTLSLGLSTLSLFLG